MEDVVKMVAKAIEERDITISRLKSKLEAMERSALDDKQIIRNMESSLSRKIEEVGSLEQDISEMHLERASDRHLIEQQQNEISRVSKHGYVNGVQDTINKIITKLGDPEGVATMEDILLYVQSPESELGKEIRDEIEEEYERKLSTLKKDILDELSGAVVNTFEWV